MKNIKLIYSSSIASTFAIIFAVVITIWGEFSLPLKNSLKDFSGHHWVSKSIFVMLIYFISLGVFYVIPKTIGPKTIHRALTSLIVITVAGILTIFLFFVGHYLGTF